MGIIEATKPEVMRELRGQPAAPSDVSEAPVVVIDALTAKINAYYDGGSRAQEPRQPDWTESYMLYRDRVITNRLTQRQSVNVPLTKETIKTILSKTDEETKVYFESLSNDKQTEIFWNEYWKWTLEEDNFEVKDIVDKKQEALYGISTIKLNLFDGRGTFEVLEPQDVIFDRFADPSDIDGTAMYVCHRNIYRSISSLNANPAYAGAGLEALKTQYASAMGLMKAEQAHSEAQRRAERMQEMGQWDTENPAVGEAFVELREHYLKMWDEPTKKLRIKLRVTAAGNSNVLVEKWLDEVLGINFFPFVKWSDDIERTDMYPDGVGDICRTPNKVLNAFFSQLVENRTLRNFGMTFYDSTKGNGAWIPQTYTAEPFGWYPVAGNPNDVTKRVEIEDLGDSMNEMNFIIGMVEKATAATATEKGVQQNGNATLGEIQLLQQSANARISSISKFYNRARKELGEKWYKMCEANADKLKPVELYKKSAKGNMFKETFNPADWKDAVGFKCMVTTTGERDAKNLEEINKLNAVAQNFQGNPAFKSILQKKSLDLIDGLPAEDIAAVMDWEKKQAEAMAAAPADGAIDPATGLPVAAPAVPALPPMRSPQRKAAPVAIAG